MRIIEVEVLGHRLLLQGEADESYVKELAYYVENQMRIISQGLAASTPTKVAILAAINITDQLFQQEKKRQAGEAEVERRTVQLLETIDGQLQAFGGFS